MSAPNSSFQFPVSSFQVAENKGPTLNSKLETRNSKLRERGLSLIELIMFIVIVGAAVAGIIGMIAMTTQSSADPMVRKQALSIAEAMLDEIRLQPFTVCDADEASGGSSPSGVVTFDAASEGHNTGASEVTSLTVSHTIGASGTERILVVGVNIYDTSTPFPTVSNMTYAGQPMTFLDGVTEGTLRVRSELWYIKAPTTGTNNIDITLSASVRGVVAGGISYTGVNQTTPFGTAATAVGSNAAPTVNVSSAVGEIVLDSVGIRQTTAQDITLAAGAGQTERYNDDSAFGTPPNNNNLVGAGSQEAGAATVTMSWSASSSRPWAMVAVPLKPGSCVENTGPEPGESRYSSTNPFDHVNDYHGFNSNTAVPPGIRTLDGTLIPGLDNYRVTVDVAASPLGGIGNDANGKPQSLLITVTVTGPGNTTVVVSGYRTRYAPNETP